MNENNEYNPEEYSLEQMPIDALISVFEMIALKYYEGFCGISMIDGGIKAWLGDKKKTDLKDEYEFDWTEDAIIYAIKKHFYRSQKEN